MDFIQAAKDHIIEYGGEDLSLRPDVSIMNGLLNDIADIERDLDIAIYKLSECLQLGCFEREHQVNIAGKYNELEDKYKYLRDPEFKKRNLNIAGITEQRNNALREIYEIKRHWKDFLEIYADLQISSNGRNISSAQEIIRQISITLDRSR